MFEGVCRTSEKHVAVKRMKKDHMSKEDEESLRSEATIMGKLSHPNITTLLDFTHEGDHYYMVLELVDGGFGAHRLAFADATAEWRAKGPPGTGPRGRRYCCS